MKTLFLIHTVRWETDEPQCPVFETGLTPVTCPAEVTWGRPCLETAAGAGLPGALQEWAPFWGSHDFTSKA